MNTNQKRIICNIVVVGCGGTGGKLSTEIFRMLTVLGDKENLKTHLTIIDGDRVEKKNIERQPFSLMDVGSHKCLALQETARECFNLEVSAYPTYLDSCDQLMSILDEESHECSRHCYTSRDFNITILCGCVDNHRARQVLEQTYQKLENVYYIDSANEFDVGEIVYGLRLNGKELSKSRAFYFPDVLTDNGPRASEISCAAENVSAPQHPGTNMMAANFMLTAISNFLVTGNFRDGIVYFNALNLSVVHRSVKTEKSSVVCDE